MFASMIISPLLTLALATVASALPHESRQVPGKAQVITSCTKAKTAALTFDDGPWVYLYDVSKTLIANNATGTFFFNGKNWGNCIYAADQVKRVKYAYDKGHQVASHTWSHSNLTLLTKDQVNTEMRRSEEAIQRITGAVPAFTRPPYGSYNDAVREVAYTRGQTIVNWDFDSGDSTVGVTPEDSKARYTELIARKPNTILALNHEVKEPTVHNVLPFAISKLKAAGYKLVSLSECLGKLAYKSVGASPAFDPTWETTQCS